MVKKVAVVGSGISGLVSAHELSSRGLHVTLFERRSQIGFDGHALAVEKGDASSFFAVDVPLRLLNRYQWPQLAQLYQRIGVETVDVDASQSFCDSDQNCYLRIDGNGLFGINPLQLLSQRARKILNQVLRLRDQGLKDLNTQAVCRSTTFSNWLSQHDFSDDFVLGFLFPILSSTVCTCSYSALRSYPARIMLDALSRITEKPSGGKHFLSRTKFGSQDVVNKLSANIGRLFLGCSVLGVRHEDDRLQLTYESRDDSVERVQEFEHVVIATQANHTSGFLNGAFRPLLSQFEYEDVEVVIHRDLQFLPENPKHWATFNFLTRGEQACCSIWLRNYYGEPGLPGDIFQTINPVFEPRESHVIHRVILQRPVVKPTSFEHWQQVADSHQVKAQRVWLVGSYATPGIPLLENGVCSSLDVASAISKSCLNEMALKTE